MAYSVDCSCGQALSVTLAQAGGTVECPCGARVAVPSLSRLKQQAGQAAYETCIVDRLRNLAAEGKLPDTQQCQNCGVVTKDQMICTVVCELPRLKDTSRGKWRWLLIFISWPLWLLAEVIAYYDKRPDAHKVQELGRELTVDLPLRMCQTCSEKFRSRKRASRELFKIVEQHPVTAELISEYPRAEVYATLR